MSASAGAVMDSEHLLEYLSHGGERVELARLNLREQPPQLRVVGDSALEMPAGAARRDCEHLACEVRATPLLELSALDEERAVLLDLLPELGDVLPPHRLGEDDRRAPLCVVVEREDRAHLVEH